MRRDAEVNRLVGLAASLFVVLATLACGGPMAQEPEVPGAAPETALATAPATVPSAGSLGASPVPEDGSKTSLPLTQPQVGGAEALLLQDQVNVLLGGNGAGTDCARDLESLPATFSTQPAVWISKAWGELPALEYGRHSALCLRGFAADEPIRVRIGAGSFNATTTVTMSPERPRLDGYLGPSTLFEDAGRLEVGATDDDLYMSEMWMLVASERAREALAESAALTITATQGAVEARHEQRVETPMIPGGLRIDGLPDDVVRLLVYGFQPGTVVPVGLYRLDDLMDTARLVDQLGSVEMPRSRVAEFTAPAEPLRGLDRQEDYCLFVPRAEQDGCPSAATSRGTQLDAWPPYPGEGSADASPEVVSVWQDILIRAGVITDIPANHDGVWGPGMERAVRDLQESYGWEPDGVAGPATYAQITGLPRPSTSE